MASRVRGMSFVAAAAGVLSMTIVAAAPSALGQSAGQPGTAVSDVRLYPLEHARAGDVAVVLGELRGADQSISLDQRTNSIIAFGDDTFQREVKNLIAMLDVEVEGVQETLVRAVPLNHAKAGDDIAVILSSVIRGHGIESLRVATDPTTNQLILRGTPRSLEAASKLIEALDRPRAAESSERDVSFRIVWLVSESHASGDVPKDMGDVIEALDDIGISDLAVAAQTVVRASNNNDFRSNCSAQLEQVWDVLIEGRARPAPDGRMRIDLQVEAAGRAEPTRAPGGQQPVLRRPERIQLATTITTTEGHFVVLSASPVRDMDSVFVIQAKSLD